MPDHGDHESEPLLAEFGRKRLAEGAHHRSVAREVSQLRSLVRDAGQHGRRPTLATLIDDIPLIARTLLEPRRPIALNRANAIGRHPALLAGHGGTPGP